MGTDGGSEPNPAGDIYRCAGWAIAVSGTRDVERDDADVHTAHGWVAGADQSSYIAELVALLILIKAAVAEKCGIFAIIDNESVMETFRNMIQGAYTIPRQCLRQWMQVSAAVARHRQLFGTAWVPAHARHDKWEPQQTGQCGKKWRRLNHFADLEATRRAKEQAKTRTQREAEVHTSATCIAAFRLDRLHQAAVRYRKRILDQLPSAAHGGRVGGHQLQ